jgi:hypothetical protein
VVMEIIILRNYELPGFIGSILAGTIVYVISSFVLGTFEEEDYILLGSVKNALPGKTKRSVDWLIGFIAQFKQSAKAPGEEGKGKQESEDSSQ